MFSNSIDNGHRAVLLVPHIRVQNANAISSPMTWGFPAISAFTGLLAALERRIGATCGLKFDAIGVICHGFEAQVATSGYVNAFHLTRNPILANGKAAGMAEEGRVHLELSLVFDVRLFGSTGDADDLTELSEQVLNCLAGMRIAGGSVMPALPNSAINKHRPSLVLVPDDTDKAREQFRRLARRCLPGFALVSRDDLLRDHLTQMQSTAPTSTAFDAMLDLSRWNHRAVETPSEKPDEPPAVKWVTDARKGWVVPMPIGFASLSKLYDPGEVAGARDMTTSFRFVESIWSMGQWISPHRLENLDQLCWYSDFDADESGGGLYRCKNDFVASQTPSFENE